MEQGLALERYIGRTTYSNVAAMEAALNKYNVEVSPDKFSAKLIMAVPMGREIFISGRKDGFSDSAVILEPEVFRFIDALFEAEVRFLPPKSGGSAKLLEHSQIPGKFLAQNAQLDIKKSGGKGPLEFRLGITKAVVLITNNTG